MMMGAMNLPILVSIALSLQSTLHCCQEQCMMANARTMALAAVTALVAVAVHGMPAAEKPDVNYWWMFHNEDCGYDDVPGSCEWWWVWACVSCGEAVQWCWQLLRVWSAVGAFGGAAYPYALHLCVFCELFLSLSLSMALLPIAVDEVACCARTCCVQTP